MQFKFNNCDKLYNTFDLHKAVLSICLDIKDLIKLFAFYSRTSSSFYSFDSLTKYSITFVITSDRPLLI